MTPLEDQTPVFEMTDVHWQSLGKSGAGHKHRYGHAVVVSGPFGQGGAARLAARGALRIGAGLVSVVCRADAVAEHAAQLNAIMVKPYADDAGFLDHLTAIKPQAICIGPNLGLSSASKTQLAQALTLGLPMCIDADAITHLSDRSEPLPEVANRQSVMTPHEGELRRFIPEVFTETSCRVTLARRAADKAGCVVLFKGPDTVIAGPDHAPMIVSSKTFQHASWLATAGSGDVLAGFITGLLARGFDGFAAACLAAELHFRCAEAFGPGLIAEDIPEMLPKVLR
ncbi:NAD(P)H-hydrate dehydratase [uncultured Sulfitobacter sp.]|uniref:NAD(P)H-hydrate dehydratase n=1 Tax=uncultured Sulfitobacter sp. TaxID=191468 RepID=UPI0030DBA393|tara:strand:+ start:80541 stop:81392 length:852 start_codon:yes stop_codon:yes gene_type:complete